MSKTLILVFHPGLSHSKCNAALAAAAASLGGVETVDIQALYPNGNIDTDAEVLRLLSADRLVLQFPVMWYAVPPILKTWLDHVLTRMFYIHYQTEGRLLEGKPLMIAATAGNGKAAYTAKGQNGYSLKTLFLPLRAMARRCKLVWSKPHFVYEAGKLSPKAQAEAAAAYRRVLARFIAQTGGEARRPPWLLAALPIMAAVGLVAAFVWFKAP